MNTPMTAPRGLPGCDLTPPTEVDVDALCPGRQASRMRSPGAGAGWPIRRHLGRGHGPGHPLLVPPVVIRRHAAGWPSAMSSDRVMAGIAADTPASALWASAGPGGWPDAHQRIRLDRRYAGEGRWAPLRADARPAGAHHVIATGYRRSGAPVCGGARPSATLGIAAAWFHHGYASPAIMRRCAALGRRRQR